MKPMVWPLMTLVACTPPSHPTKPPVELAVERVDPSALGVVGAGRVIVLDFWAAWCAPCIEELPKLNRLSEVYASEGVVVVGVHVGGERSEVERFAKDAGIRYTVMIDEDFSYSQSLGAERVPTVVLLDTYGREVARSARVDGSLLEQLEALVHRTTEG